MKESVIERALVREVKKLGGRCYKFVSPGCAGVPDRLILLPKGRLAFVELKAPGKQERALQRLKQAQMRELGATVYSSIDSKEKIAELLQDMMSKGGN